MSWQHAPFAVALCFTLIATGVDFVRWARIVAQLLRERR